MSEWWTVVQISEQLQVDYLDASLREQLLTELTSGRLRSRARAAILTLGERIDRETDWEIPPAFWIQRNPSQHLFLNFETDVAINLDAALTIIRRSQSAIDNVLSPDRLGVECRGLQFSRDDLTDLFGLPTPATAPPTETKPKSGGGRKPSPSWPDFPAALAVWVHRRDDMAANMANAGPDELMNELCQIAESEWGIELPRSTFQPGVARFQERMHEESRNGR